MPSTSISEHFARLGAPLKNQRWSWGAISIDGQRTILRVWQNETSKVDGAMAVVLTNRARFQDTDDLGYHERLDHIEKIKSGTPGFLVFCVPVQPLTDPRQLKDFIRDKIFPIEQILDHHGDIWARFGVPIKTNLARKSSTPPLAQC